MKYDENKKDLFSTCCFTLGHINFLTVNKTKNDGIKQRK